MTSGNEGESKEKERGEKGEGGQREDGRGRRSKEGGGWETPTKNKNPTLRMWGTIKHFVPEPAGVCENN